MTNGYRHVIELGFGQDEADRKAFLPQGVEKPVHRINLAHGRAFWNDAAAPSRAAMHNRCLFIFVLIPLGVKTDLWRSVGRGGTNKKSSWKEC